MIRSRNNMACIAWAKFLVGFALAFPAMALASSPAVWTARARAQIEDSRHADALASVDSALAEDSEYIEARVLRARILAWQGKYAPAEAELSALLVHYPDDADARLTLAYLRYYQNRLEEAAAMFRGLLAANSGNKDARDGLASVEKALAAPPPRLWRVDAGLEYSAFTRREQPAWNQQSLQVTRALKDGKTSVYGRTELYRQFEMSDFALEAGVSRILHPRANAALAAGWTLAPDFRPDWRVSAEAGFLALPKSSVTAAPTAWVLLGTRYDAYETVEVAGFHPALLLAWKDPWSVTARLSRVQEIGADALYGGSVRFDGPTGLPRMGPVKAGTRFWVGFADAPEAVRAVIVSTRTVFFGIGGDVGEDWSFNVGYARDDREDSWVRHGVNAGVAHKF